MPALPWGRSEHPGVHSSRIRLAPDDAAGKLVPRAAHIRKAYPRNEKTPTGGEADTQTHRILRRGIPYGESFREGAAP